MGSERGDGYETGTRASKETEASEDGDATRTDQVSAETDPNSSSHAWDESSTTADDGAAAADPSTTEANTDTDANLSIDPG